MRIVALEEHFVPADLFAAWAALPEGQRDLSYGQSATGDIRRRLLDMLDERVRDMDRAGVDVQVLSLTTAGVQSLPDAVPMSRRMNDFAMQVVRSRPDRFQAFATLPMSSPAEAVEELRRAITELKLSGVMIYGRVGDRDLDDRAFWPVYEAAASLRAPIYVHPQSPVNAVREAYYSGFGDELDSAFATGGIGWHYETGVQILRLILSGAFDAMPDLQLLLGHWGEVVMFYLHRVDQLTKLSGLKQKVSDYWRAHVSVTPSGIFSAQYLAWAVEVLGPDRILFATDYPYQIGSAGEARRFVEQAGLSPEAREKFASTNWERLVSRIRRDA